MYHRAVLIPGNIGLPARDAVQTAVATPDLSALVDALGNASLVQALSSPNGPFVIFAPLNSAFAKVPPQAVSTLQKLQDVLKYHVVANTRMYAADFGANTTLTTLEGKTLTVTKVGSQIQVNGANVVTADVDCSNAVVYLIDDVLLPDVVPGNGAGSVGVAAATAAVVLVAALRELF